jgi:hypothetical protein
VWVEYRDYVGNESVAYEDTIILDTHPPSGEIYTITESSPYAHSTGYTVYYGDDGSGQFEVQVQASDERSGLDRAEFPAVTSVGGTNGTPQGGAYQFAHTYAFTAGVSTAAGSYDVRVYDGAGNDTGVPFTVVRDIISPTVVVQAVADGAVIAVSWAGTTDGGSGVAWYDLDVSVVLHVRSGCVATGGPWQQLLAQTTDTSYRYVGENEQSYTFRVTATDNVGNADTGDTSVTTLSGVTKYYYFNGQRVAMRGPDNAVTWLHSDHPSFYSGL